MEKGRKREGGEERRGGGGEGGGGEYIFSALSQCLSVFVVM